MTAFPVLHAVTNDEIVLKSDFPELAAAFAEAAGNRGAIHLRCRWITGRRVYELATELMALQHRTGCLCIVNDRVDAACAAGATHVQLTSRSVAPHDARRVRRNLVLGASVHSLAEALHSESDGVAWCVVGSAFPTPTHPGAEPGGIELVAAVCAAVRVPVVAIGGVTPERVAALRSAGVHGVAAITGLWHSSGVSAAVRRYLSEYDGHERAL